MTVSAVQERHQNTSLSNVVKASSVGVLAGYALKHLYPLTDREMDADYTADLKVIKSQFKDDAIQKIRNNPERTPAQDVFIKMVDEIAASAPKDVTKPKTPTYRFLIEDAVKTYGEKSEIAILGDVERKVKLAEFGKNLQNELLGVTTGVNKGIKTAFNRYKSIYDGGLKSIRLTPPFIIGGLALGFIYGVSKNVMGTKIEANS